MNHAIQYPRILVTTPGWSLQLVVIEKRTKYPEVEQVYSTSFRSAARKFKKIFSLHGVPG